MNIEEAVLERLQLLSDEDKRKVLDFVQTLPATVPSAPARKNPKGMFDHLGGHITLEDIRQARQERWAHFPRPCPGDEKTRAPCSCPRTRRQYDLASTDLSA